MSESERDRHHEEARAYMRNCSERQLANIEADEAKREKLGGEVGEVAHIMLFECRREIYRRIEN